MSHLEQDLVLRKFYISYCSIVSCIYHYSFERSRMERGNLGLWNELELSSIPALRVLGSTTIKRGQPSLPKNPPLGLGEKLNKMSMCPVQCVALRSIQAIFVPSPLCQGTVLRGRDINMNKR